MENLLVNLFAFEWWRLIQYIHDTNKIKKIYLRLPENFKLVITDVKLTKELFHVSDMIHYAISYNGRLKR